MGQPCESSVYQVGTRQEDERTTVVEASEKKLRELGVFDDEDENNSDDKSATSEG